MAGLGSNGGLLGSRRVPAVASASGLWFPNEQSLARRAGIWPSVMPTNYVLELDAKNYSTGQTFANSAVSPADGASQADYDFVLGSTTSAASNDPTFVSGGDASYFSFDGGDFFTLSIGATSTAFLKNLHKTGAAFSIEVWFRYSGSDVLQSSFFDSGTSDQGGSDMSRGVIYTCTDGAGQQLRIKRDSSGASAFEQRASTSFSTGIHMAGVSYQAGGTSFFYRNGAYDQVSGNDTFTATLSTPGSSDVVNPARIGTRGDGVTTFCVPNGTRLYRLAIYNTALTKQNFDSVWAFHRDRFGI